MKIGDFGLAIEGNPKHNRKPQRSITPEERLQMLNDVESAKKARQLTTGVGTLLYSAPEQLRGKGVRIESIISFFS